MPPDSKGDSGKTTIGGSILQENDLIAIAGVFGLTFLLISLYHLIGTIGRLSKRYRAPIKQVSERDQGQQTNRMKSKEPLTSGWSH
jgi:hypothetical protein